MPVFERISYQNERRIKFQNPKVTMGLQQRHVQINYNSKTTKEYLANKPFSVTRTIQNLLFK